MNQLAYRYPPSALLPAQLFAPTPEAAKRVLEFFTAQINYDHTRKAYLSPAHAVRGPKYVVKKGKTPVFLTKTILVFKAM